jgi:hypothetical protein
MVPLRVGLGDVDGVTPYERCGTQACAEVRWQFWGRPCNLAFWTGASLLVDGSLSSWFLGRLATAAGLGTPSHDLGFACPSRSTDSSGARKGRMRYSRSGTSGVSCGRRAGPRNCLWDGARSAYAGKRREGSMVPPPDWLMQWTQWLSLVAGIVFGCPALWTGARVLRLTRRRLEQRLGGSVK